MKYAIYTLGCKVNTFESESVANSLDQNGYIRVDNKDVADIYIINTCTVTNKSDSKSRKVIRSAIRRNMDAIIVVMGCYAQISSEEISEIDGVDIILGNVEKSNVVEILEQYRKNNRKIIEVSDIMKSKVLSELATDTFYENTRAFLKIQDGCDNFCSFCIIPFARGLMRSKPKDQVIQEVKDLIENGFYEIVLTGIHTGGYGSDIPNYTFSDLIADILEVEGLARLRISSIEINQIDDKLIDMMNSNAKLAKHLHIPIQSGSDEVLKSMQRKYTTEEFYEKIKYIKKRINSLSITTDIIVGYPIETDVLFEESYKNCEKFEFSELHVFPYSKRNGTPAAKLEQVDDLVKKSRVDELLSLSKKLQQEFYVSQVGLEDTIIIEKIKDNIAYGKTSNYINVGVDNKNYQVGEILNIRITSYEEDYCFAVVFSNNDIIRCDWAVDELNIKYHDEEWGVPVYDDKVLFEFLVLEGAQAGLSWTTILKKREGYKNVFFNYDLKILSNLSDEELDKLKLDDRIVRNKLKIYSVRSNASAFLKVQEEFGTFSNYIWSFTNYKVIRNCCKSSTELPTETELSRKISKDLLKRGFKFVGPSIVYAYMQAVGIVDDHIEGCFVKNEKD